MKRANTFCIAAWFCLLFVFNSFAQSPDPSYIIDQVSVNQGEFSTRIVLQSKSPPPPFSTYYSTDSPATIVEDAKRHKDVDVAVAVDLGVG